MKTMNKIKSVFLASALLCMMPSVSKADLTEILQKYCVPKDGSNCTGASRATYNGKSSGNTCDCSSTDMYYNVDNRACENCPDGKTVDPENNYQCKALNCIEEIIQKQNPNPNSGFFFYTICATKEEQCDINKYVNFESSETYKKNNQMLLAFWHPFNKDKYNLKLKNNNINIYDSNDLEDIVENACKINNNNYKYTAIMVPLTGYSLDNNTLNFKYYGTLSAFLHPFHNYHKHDYYNFIFTSSKVNIVAEHTHDYDDYDEDTMEDELIYCEVNIDDYKGQLDCLYAPMCNNNIFNTPCVYGGNKNYHKLEFELKDMKIYGLSDYFKYENFNTIKDSEITNIAFNDSFDNVKKQYNTYYNRRSSPYCAKLECNAVNSSSSSGGSQYGLTNNPREQGDYGVVINQANTTAGTFSPNCGRAYGSLVTLGGSMTSYSTSYKYICKLTGSKREFWDSMTDTGDDLCGTFYYASECVQTNGNVTIKDGSVQGL